MQQNEILNQILTKLPYTVILAITLIVIRDVIKCYKNYVVPPIIIIRLNHS